MALQKERRNAFVVVESGLVTLNGFPVPVGAILFYAGRKRLDSFNTKVVVYRVKRPLALFRRVVVTTSTRDALRVVSATPHTFNKPDTE